MRWTRRVRLRPGRAEPDAATVFPPSGADAPDGGAAAVTEPQASPPVASPERRLGVGWRTLAIGVAGAVVGGSLIYFGLPAYRVLAAGVEIRTLPLTPQQESAASPAAAVYRVLSPSVVLVQNESAVSSPFGSGTTIAWGSGVIFNSAGYIVTNDHVVAGASKVTVTLKDGATYPAQVIGGDASTDLAVLKINAGKPLPAATFANSNDVVPGEIAIAIGNPLGPQYAQTVTAGIVGAIRPMLYGLSSATERVTEMIQTDAAINPGNSGGALANAQGEVIGITSMKVAQTGETGVSATGLGFAIPSNVVQRVVNDILRYGYVKWAWLGIDLSSSGVSPTSTTPVTAPETLTVTAVTAGGPSAGQLRPGDVITSWNGQRVINYYDLVTDINAAHPGQSVALGILRDGRALTVHVTLGTEPRSLVNQTQTRQVPAQPAPIVPYPYPFPFG